MKTKTCIIIYGIYEIGGFAGIWRVFSSNKRKEAYEYFEYIQGEKFKHKIKFTLAEIPLN